MNKKILLLGLVGLSFMPFGSASAATVDGFRHARFGAAEPAVIDAIKTDLKVKENEIMRKTDDVAKVKVLSVKLKAFEPMDVPASVNYVMGYKCNCLTQVTVSWEMPEKISAEQRSIAMRGVGALVEKFKAMGWDKDEVVLNHVPGEVKEGTDSAVIFFRGQNKQGQAIALLGAPVKMIKNPTPQADSDAKNKGLAANIDSVKNVTLVYERNALAPDVYKVDVSGF